MQSLDWTDSVRDALANPQGQRERLKKLVDQPSDQPSFEPNFSNSAGVTPLKVAVMYGGADQVHVLLEKGAVATEEIISFAKDRYPHKPRVADTLRIWRARVAAEQANSEIG